MSNIIKKELNDFFINPIGYIILTAFYLLSLIMFFINNILRLSSSYTGFYMAVSYILILLCPAISMKSFSSEYRQSTDNIIFTYPIAVKDIVLGKFIAMSIFLSMNLIMLCNFSIIIALYGEFYFAEFFIGLIGLQLEGMAFLAINLFIASLTKTSASCVSLQISINLFIWLINIFNGNKINSALKILFNIVDVNSHYNSFAAAQISFSNIAYFLMIIVAFISLTIINLRVRKN